MLISFKWVYAKRIYLERDEANDFAEFVAANDEDTTLCAETTGEDVAESTAVSFSWELDKRLILF